MRITPEEVISTLDRMPAFPAIVKQILETLDDDNAAMGVLVNHLQHDPVISARILAAANRLIRHSGREPVGDVFTAASYMGLSNIHKIVVSTSLLDFSKNTHCSSSFWEHNLAVGLCAQELALAHGINPDRALVAGLLHAVGALWINFFHPHEYQQILIEHQLRNQDTAIVERSILGLDQGQIGQLLAQHWNLPVDIVLAIAYHHEPHGTPISPLVAITHLAKLICVGLDLPYQASHQIAGLSAEAMNVLGDGWADNLHELFGRVESRFRLTRTVLL